MILFTIFKKTYKFLLTLILSLLLGIIIPLLIIIISPIYLLRWILFYTAKIFKPELGKMLTTRSTSMILEDNIYGIPKASEIFSLVLEGRPSIEHIRDIITQNGINALSPKTGELLYPELKQNITFVLGFPFFTHVKDFKLEDHVYEAEEYISQPMDYTAMKKFMTDLSKKPFSKDRAMCEFIFVRNYIPNSKVYGNNDNCEYSLMFCRLHHAMGDGFAKMKFLKTFGNNVTFQDQLSKSSRSKKTTTSYLDLIGILCTPLTAPYKVAKLLVKKLTGQSLKWEFKTDKCDSICYANTDLIPVTDIKEIKNRYGVSFNAVVLSGVSRTIQKLLLSSGNVKKIPKNVDILMPFPLPNHPDKLRNHMMGALVTVPLGLNKGNPVERLMSIERILNDMKRSKLGMVVNKYVMPVIGGLPVPFRRPIANLINEEHAIILTNFPGPSETLDFVGCPLKELFMCSNLMAGSNLVLFAFISQGGYSRFTVGADSSIIPSDLEATYLTEVFCNELEVLKTWKDGYEIV